MPKVYRIGDEGIPPDAVFIGRPTEWGNPYRIGKDGTREEVIFKHAMHIQREGLVDHIRTQLYGKSLVCHCKPQLCHGDTLLMVANIPAVVGAFRGDYEFLSNFYASPIRTKAGIIFPTSEHAYQAFKTKDMNTRKYIATLASPAASKAFCRSFRIRPDWDDVRLNFMYRVVYSKFKQNQYLTMLLINTCDSVLIEGNYWNDTFWGVCNGIGDNNLGKVLMRVRDELRDLYCK